jgi:hypothetical protein
MKTKLMMLTLAGLLAITGCNKSATDSSNNAAPGANGSTGAPDANNAMQGNGPAMQAQAPQAMQQAATPPPAPKPPFVVPAGRSVTVTLTDTLSSRVNKEGDPFTGVVTTSVMVDGEVAIPKGSAVAGTVDDAKKQGAFKGEATLGVRINQITVRGKQYAVASAMYVETEKGKGKRTAVVTGGGAALGAIIGGIAGGGKGALIGGAVGGGGGAAASAGTGGKNVTLASESQVTFKLSTPVTIERAASEQ